MYMCVYIYIYKTFQRRSAQTHTHTHLRAAPGAEAREVPGDFAESFRENNNNNNIDNNNGNDNDNNDNNVFTASLNRRMPLACDSDTPDLLHVLRHALLRWFLRSELRIGSRKHSCLNMASTYHMSAYSAGHKLPAIYILVQR